MPEYGFSSIIGNEAVKDVLRRTAKERRPFHAYLIEGDEGSGKRRFADAFAMALQCETLGAGSGEDSCGTCLACRRYLSGNQPDVHVVTHEKTVISVDDIRTQLVGKAQIRPYEYKYQIYIVPEAEKMNPQAQNALLKTLEEPRGDVVILLLTTNADAFLPTIRSRCCLLRLAPLSDAQVEKALLEGKPPAPAAAPAPKKPARTRKKGGNTAEEQPEDPEKLRKEQASDPLRPQEEQPLTSVSPQEARLIAAFSGGSIGRARKLAYSTDFAEQKERILELLSANAPGQELLQKAFKDREREESLTMTEMALLWFYDLLLIRSVGKEASEFLTYKDKERQLRRQADRFSLSALGNILEDTSRCSRMIQSYVKPEDAWSWLLLRIREAENGSVS